MPASWPLKQDRSLPDSFQPPCSQAGVMSVERNEVVPQWFRTWLGAQLPIRESALPHVGFVLDHVTTEGLRFLACKMEVVMVICTMALL